MTRLKILKYVCSYEQGKALRELGILQDKSTYFLNRTGNDYTLTHTFIHPFEIAEQNPWVAVFTVAELGMLLPVGAVSYKKEEDKWVAEYITTATKYLIPDHQTEAQARAELLLQLLRNNVMTTDEINQKLVLIDSAKSNQAEAYK